MSKARHHDDCETCGRQDETMYSCQDTVFCADCWNDFGTDRWKGIGSKMVPPSEARNTSDEDCCDCVYGDEFIDDGIPHRYITLMCGPCKKATEKTLDFLMVTQAERLPSQGDA